MSRSLLFVISLLTTALPAYAAKPSACADGRFLVADSVTLVGALPSSGVDAVTLATRSVGIESGCAAKSAKVKASKKATLLSVTWPSCGERRKVRLKARIASPDCSTMTGKVFAKKTKAISFTATRSRCGDGIIDSGEGCEGLTGCSIGTTCSDSCECVSDSPGDPTPALLNAARIALAGGATDVALSPDGTLRFKRSSIAGGDRDELVRNGVTIARWDHVGDATTITVDDDGDGNPEISGNVSRAAPVTTTLRFDPNDDGTVDFTETLTQVDPDGLTVSQQTGNETPVGFSTTRRQAAAAIPRPANDGDGCTGTQLTQARNALDDATFSGIACLRNFGLGEIADVIAGKIARDGVELRCGGTDDCAQIDISDTLTRGSFPGPVGISIGAPFFNGAPACSNNKLIMFHELLHMGIGSAHSLGLDRSTFTGLATDKVYSCADLCFRPALATKDECARCLDVDECDPQCAGFRDNPERVSNCVDSIQITSKDCATSSCECCQGSPLCNGVRWTEHMSGTVSGSVGAILRVNFPTNLGGSIECPGWTPHTCDQNLACCRRASGDQPRTIGWSATFTFPFSQSLQCICPTPEPTSVGIVAQVVSAQGTEDTGELICPE